MARTVAKRSSEPGWARVFGVCGILKQCRIFEPCFMPPLRGSHLFLWPFPGVWGFESSLSTPSQAAPCGAPPPGYFMAPLRGSELGSRLRCCAATPRQALALAPPRLSGVLRAGWQGIFASASEHVVLLAGVCPPNLKPRMGRRTLGRRWSERKRTEPLYSNKKRKWNPGNLW